MPYGLKDIELAKLNEVFATNERIERVVLYGSRAKGNYKPFSDVDITLEGDELTHTDLSRLSLAIDDLLLPYQFDISIFHTMKNEALIDHIRRMGITIYEKKSEWKEIKLGDCVEAIIDNRGKSAPTKQTGEYPLLEINSIGGYYPNYGVVRKYVDETTFKTWFRSGHPASGDILIPTVGTIGILSIMDNKKACIAQNIIALRINKDVSNVFIYYYLKSPIVKQELLNLDIGGVQPSIKVPHLLDLSISLPPKEVQVNIASVLSSFDDKIDLLHRENATLEQMAETLFRQWFVVEAKEEWEEQPLKQVVDIAIGRTPPRKESKWFSTNPNDVKWLSIKDMGGDSVFLFNTSEYLTEEAVETFSIPIIPVNTVVLSFKMTVGRVGITTEKMLSNEAIAHFKFNKSTPFTKEYLYLFLKLYKYDMLGTTSSIVTSINSAMIKDMMIPIPDGKTMDSFKKQTQTIFDKIYSNQKQIQILNQTRDGLLPKLMSNEITL